MVSGLEKNPGDRQKCQDTTDIYLKCKSDEVGVVSAVVLAEGQGAHNHGSLGTTWKMNLPRLLIQHLGTDMELLNFCQFLSDFT